MPRKKSDKSEQSAEQQALEQRVDSMMNTEVSGAEPAATNEIPIEASASKKSSDSATSSTTAPKLPKKLLKGIEVDGSSEPPIVIKLADESKTSVEPEQQAEPESLEGNQANDILESSDTDKAVDDIVAHEGDTVLAVDDALAARRNATIVSDDSPSTVKTLAWLIVFVLAAVIIYLSYQYLGL